MAGFFLNGGRRFLAVFAVLLGAALVLAWRFSFAPAAPADAGNGLIRLHVIANSDSPADQAVKYQVRDAIVGVMGEKFSRAGNAQEARLIVQENLDCIRQLAVEKVRSAGRDYPVTVELGRFPFPARTYHGSFADFTLPAGNYEAVRVILGRGAGANWWCVLFPPLCFVDPGSVAPPVMGGEKPGAGTVSGEEGGKPEDGRDSDKEREIEREIRLTEKDGEAAPAFKLNVPEALLAVQKENGPAITVTAAGERVEFRFRVLDFLKQSAGWFKAQAFHPGK
ncbi:MAG: stage II sporulation protein R [Desulfotomaculales bacterium]